ncbi:MAG: hypothetical protein ACFFER_07375 [Candidatus Thorarchaeota archaeon]
MAYLELSDPVFDSFSKIVIHLDNLAKEHHLNFFSQIAGFIGLVRESLVKGVELPRSRIPITRLTKRHEELIDAKLLLYDGREGHGLPDALEFYQEALDYFDYSKDAVKTIKALTDYLNLFVVYKLWTPGLITSKGLAEFAGKNPNEVSNNLQSLQKSKIIERRAHGIYDRGKNGKIAMDLFAILSVLWRRADDSYRQLPIKNIIRPVRYQLEDETIIDRIRNHHVPAQQVPVAEPILVQVIGNGTVKYCRRYNYLYRYGKALDSFFDKEPSRAKFTKSLSLQTFTGEIVGSSMKVATALDKSVSERRVLFVDTTSGLHFVPPLADCLDF